jgi:hypothetical protein
MLLGNGGDVGVMVGFVEPQDSGVDRGLILGLVEGLGEGKFLDVLGKVRAANQGIGQEPPSGGVGVVVEMVCGGAVEAAGGETEGAEGGNTGVDV